MADQEEAGYDEETAAKICGSIKAKNGSRMPADKAEARALAEKELDLKPEEHARSGAAGQLWAVIRGLFEASRGRPAHIVRPNANDHCCQVGTLGDFKPDSFRRSKRSHEGKGLAAIIGTVAKDGSTADAAIHYNSDDWEEDAARAHCKSCGGKFELAKTKRKGRAIAYRDIAMQVQTALSPLSPEGMMMPDAPFLLDIYEDAGAVFAIAARAGKLVKYPLTMAAGNVSIGAEQQVEVSFTPRSAWHIVRQADGSRRWFAVAATAVLNRVGEIDSKALFDDLVRNLPDNPATLRFYHDPNLEFGDIDWAEREGNVLLESGTLRDGPLADAFVDAVENDRGKWGTSIKYQPTAEPEPLEAGPGVTIPVYRAGVQAELSVLPEDAAAAWFTTITPEVKRMDKRIEDALVRLFGDEGKAKDFIEKVDGTNRSIADAGLVTRQAPPADATPAATPAATTTPATPPTLTLEDVNRAAGALLADALSKIPAPPKPVDLKPLTDSLTALGERIATLEKVEREREDTRTADMPRQRAADPSYRPSQNGQPAQPGTMADAAKATLAKMKPERRP
jgi:hypothetical protein